MSMEIKVDASELQRLKEKLEGAPEAIRDAKRQTFEAAAPKLKAALDEQIPYGEKGKVQGWQWGVAKGGYAAVRPRPETYDDSGYAVGYVTRSINDGHRFPRPSGLDEHYKPKIKIAGMAVPGKFFYQAAEVQVEQVAKRAAEDLLNTVKQQLE